MIPVVTIRPEPGNAATCAAGAALGLAMIGCPLSELRPLPWQVPDPDEFDALLLGSANALPMAAELPLETTWLPMVTTKPALCVGEATAAAARALGTPVLGVGRGGLQQLLDGTDPLPPRLLRLGGADHVPVTAPPGVSILFRAVYHLAPLPLPDRLRAPFVLLLHSAAAAGHFRTQWTGPRDAIRIAALGPRIAAAAGPGWAELRCPAQPTDAALLALAAKMCHDAAQWGEER